MLYFAFIYLPHADDNIINRTDSTEQNLIDCWNFKFDDEAYYRAHASFNDDGDVIKAHTVVP